MGFILIRIMKKVLFTAFVMLSLHSFSQDKKIEGLGIFKINSSNISIINDISELLNVQLKSSYSFTELYNMNMSRGNYVVQTHIDTNKTGDTPTGSCLWDQVKTFSVKGYSVSGIDLNDLILKFYHDTLFYISCDLTTNVSEALKLKYGQGVVESNEKDVVCTNYSTGLKRNVKETSIYETWSNGDIQAISRVLEFYSYKCERNIASGFSIYSKTINTMVYYKVDEIERKIRTNKNAIKKEKLEGF